MFVLNETQLDAVTGGCGCCPVVDNFLIDQFRSYHLGQGSIWGYAPSIDTTLPIPVPPPPQP